MPPEPAPAAETEKPLTSERKSLVVPGGFLTLVILGCLGMGLVIYWLLRSMHI